MQSRGEPLQNIIASKYKLFIIISVSVISILAIPVIFPHLTHTNMIYHIFLHIVSLIIAIFLSVVSILAYKRNGGARLLFMSLGFLSLAIVEIMYLYYSTIEVEDTTIPGVNIEIPHMILLVMLTLFGIGVFKVNNKF
jgi:NO-binding membrane sensor protein with MHYT domain